MFSCSSSFCGTAYPRIHETLSVDCLFLRSLSVGCLFLRSPSRVPYSLLIVYFLRSPSRVLYRTELIPRAPKWRRTRTPLSVDCLFLRSPSRVLYRTELIPLRISIGMPNFEMPNLDSVLLVQWLTESRLGISLLVQWLTESRFRNLAFEIRNELLAALQ